MDMQALLAERARLTGELDRVNRAISALETGAPVFIRTNKNLRNARGFTVHPDLVEEYGWVLVFEDKGLTRTADSRNHEGWISSTDFSRLEALPGDFAEYYVASESAS